MSRKSVFTGLRAPNRIDLAFLQRAEELHLRVERATRRPRREQRAAVGFHELPTRYSMAPVKAPFSWPNRIRSTQVSGIAPQFTVMNACLPARALNAWIARATISLADAGFAFDDDRDVGIGGALAELDDALPSPATG
ncbi:MAG: hypothetical protein M5U28_29255 [Sandaracinaceae bacterium]|nr:hypothetical protein [Sandaracinaceae bacterium]